MKTLSLIFLLFLFLSEERASGQEQIATDNNMSFENGLGVAAGYTTGYGLSYRFQPKKFGVQITFCPYKDELTTQFSAGLTFLYKLIESKDKDMNFFIYQSNSFYYSKTFDYSYYPSGVFIAVPSNEGPFNVYSKTNYFNDGIGIGIEFYILKWFDFDLMGGYASYKNFTQLKLTGETCLLFKF